MQGMGRDIAGMGRGDDKGQGNAYGASVKGIGILLSGLGMLQIITNVIDFVLNLPMCRVRTELETEEDRDCESS